MEQALAYWMALLDRLTSEHLHTVYDHSGSTYRDGVRKLIVFSEGIEALQLPRHVAMAACHATHASIESYVHCRSTLSAPAEPKSPLLRELAADILSQHLVIDPALMRRVDRGRLPVSTHDQRLAVLYVLANLACLLALEREAADSLRAFQLSKP